MLRPQIGVLALVAVRLYREGIVHALARDPRLLVCGGCATLEEATARLEALPEPPDVLLVDLGLPEGTQAARSLGAAWPSVSIVALAVDVIDDEVVRWAEAGVSGLVTRDATLAELLEAVVAAADDAAATSPAVTAALLRRVAAVAGEQARRDGPPLTRRERQIVQLIDRGLSNKEIAGSLQIELPTVKNHVHNILEKLRVGRRRDAGAAARARGELGGI